MPEGGREKMRRRENEKVKGRDCVKKRMKVTGHLVIESLVVLS